MTSDPREVLETACQQAGVDGTNAHLVRHGENTIFALEHIGAVARVTRPGRTDVARKELTVSAWLTTVGVPVAEALDGLDQPVVVDGCAVTWWKRLDITAPGTVADVARLVRLVHDQQPPQSLKLPPLQPFIRINDRIDSAEMWSAGDREWLHTRLAELQQQYSDLPQGSNWGAVHGDAWPGNVVRTPAGAVLLDLERFCVGPPEWDLVSTAVKHATFGTVTKPEWESYCDIYGRDVTDWPGYEILCAIRELRETTFAAQAAPHYPAAGPQARYRLECLQGHHGPRPWGWRGYTHVGGHGGTTT